MQNLMLPNIPNAFEAGRQIGRQRRVEAMTESAGKKLTSGDWRGAANDLAPFAPDQAATIQKQGADQERQAAQTQAAQTAMSGDIAGAKQQYQALGDLEGWSALDQQEKEQISGAYEYAGKIAYGLKQVPLEQRKAYALEAAKRSPYAAVLVPQIEGDDDWSDASLEQAINASVSMKDLFARDRGLAQDAERVRHNKAMENRRPNVQTDLEDDENPDAYPDEVLP